MKMDKIGVQITIDYKNKYGIDTETKFNLYLKYELDKNMILKSIKDILKSCKPSMNTMITLQEINESYKTLDYVRFAIEYSSTMQTLKFNRYKNEYEYDEESKQEYSINKMIKILDNLL